LKPITGKPDQTALEPPSRAGGELETYFLL
jgi:hypothetical protein